MPGKRFFISWIVSSVTMFTASYVWHGIVLTDFSRLSYPKEIFLVVAAAVYFIIGLLLNKVFEIKQLDRFERSPLARGAAAGAMVGIFLFLIAMVMGVSFGGTRTLVNLMVDVCWQVVEQMLGGIAIGLVHFFVYEEQTFPADHDDQ